MSMDLFGEVAGRIGFEGGGGGSTVTITPTYSSGTKLADFTIGETSGAIFVDLSDYLTESEIASAYFTKGEVNTMLLADRQYEDLTFQRRDEMSNYQPKLTAGANITIDVDNVISASGGSSWDYSTSEVNTGQKWINGHDIYCRVIMLNNRISVSNNYSTIVGNVPNIEYLIDATCYDNNGGTDYQLIRTINNANMEVLVNNDDIIVNYSGTSNYTQLIGLCIKYTKSV